MVFLVVQRSTFWVTGRGMSGDVHPTERRLPNLASRVLVGHKCRCGLCQKSHSDSQTLKSREMRR